MNKQKIFEGEIRRLTFFRKPLVPGFCPSNGFVDTVFTVKAILRILYKKRILYKIKQIKFNFRYTNYTER